MHRVAADESVLADIVRRLVQAVDPDRIVLFGSRARGDPSMNSDLDLLVVKASHTPRHQRAIPAYRALWGVRVPVDILWYTPEEMEEWSGVANHVVTRALREGRVIYEKQP